MLLSLNHKSWSKPWPTLQLLLFPSAWWALWVRGDPTYSLEGSFAPWSNACSCIDSSAMSLDQTPLASHTCCVDCWLPACISSMIPNSSLRELNKVTRMCLLMPCCYSWTSLCCSLEFFKSCRSLMMMMEKIRRKSEPANYKNKNLLELICLTNEFNSHSIFPTKI